jgi:transketolase
LFERQPKRYREDVLPPGIRARVAIEAAATFGWSRYTGDGGIAIGLDHFGASAPQGEIYRQFDLTPARVMAAVREVLARSA